MKIVWDGYHAYSDDYRETFKAVLFTDTAQRMRDVIETMEFSGIAEKRKEGQRWKGVSNTWLNHRFAPSKEVNTNLAAKWLHFRGKSVVHLGPSAFQRDFPLLVWIWVIILPRLLLASLRNWEKHFDVMKAPRNSHIRFILSKEGQALHYSVVSIFWFLYHLRVIRRYNIAYIV